MGDRYVATVRFHTEGVEAELYQRLLDGKRDSGLSVPDYIKRILAEHFANKDRQDCTELPAPSEEIPEGALDFLNE